MKHAKIGMDIVFSLCENVTFFNYAERYTTFATNFCSIDFCPQQMN